MKDFWNERFGAVEYFYGKGPNNFLKTSSQIISPSSRVLCIGEGEGRNGVYLATLGHNVTAVDLSTEGKLKAERLAKEHQVNLDYRVADLVSFDMGVQNWDAIVSIFCHLPIEVRHLVHQKVAEGLRPGGVFILQSYNPDQLKFNTGGPKDINMLYTKEILLNDFPGLNWKKLENSNEEIHEGVGHQGMSSLLSGIGVK